MFSIIDISQQHKWFHWLEGFPERDVYYLPDYLAICIKAGDGYPYAAYYEDENGRVFYPFLERTISDIPWLADTTEWQEYTDYKDIATPYGFGGPLISCQEEKRRKLVTAFREEFNRYCQENKIVSEFIRFHPLLNNHLGFEDNLNIQFNRPTVVMELQQGQEKIWENMSKECRKKTRKAIRNGVCVDFSSTEKDLDEFIRLYHLTMGKLKAQNHYYFNNDYFYSLRNQLNREFLLVNSRINGITAASSIFFCCGSFMGCHLRASDPSTHEFAPNNLLLFEAACYGAEKGFKYLHLGGGYSENDSLFDFKKGFAPNGICEFWIGRKIHIENIYLSLENLFRKRNNNPFVDTDFFPAYRA